MTVEGEPLGNIHFRDRSRATDRILSSGCLQFNYLNNHPTTETLQMRSI